MNSRADAFELACQDKKAGDYCSAVTAANHSVEGTCFDPMPPDLELDDVDKDHQLHRPPIHCRVAHPGEVACRDKDDGAECEFSRPGEATANQGKCMSLSLIHI